MGFERQSEFGHFGDAAADVSSPAPDEVADLRSASQLRRQARQVLRKCRERRRDFGKVRTGVQI